MLLRRGHNSKQAANEGKNIDMNMWKFISILLNLPDTVRATTTLTTVAHAVG